MKKKHHAISYLENSISSIEQYLQFEPDDTTMPITPELIKALGSEAQKILRFCNTINNSDIIYKLNDKINRDTSNNPIIKAEQFFISDLINAYQYTKHKESPVSRFVLAYYYDAIRNNQFADERGLRSLNKLVLSDDFTTHLNRIKAENTFSIDKTNPVYYFIPSALAQNENEKLDTALQHVRVFIEQAFNLKLTDISALKHLIGFEPVQAKEKSKSISSLKEEDTLEDVMAELNALVGLENVKNDVAELINLLEIQKKRTSKGLKNTEVTLHSVFLGPPGTGKTSVARLLSRIFKHLGFLSKGQLFETDREGMVAGYVGQTASKVEKAVSESIGGVLFIDEAYALSQNLLGNDYGSEAISTLLKRMEDKRNDLVVVVAGYTEPMKAFIESNPGLNSRFNRFFYFKHFTSDELFQIFQNFCKRSDFLISKEAQEKLTDTFDLLYAKKDDGFGNARVVRNLFERCVQNQANRIIKLKKITNITLKTLTEEDVPEPKETEKRVYFDVNDD